jgi:hypothetical protein
VLEGLGRPDRITADDHRERLFDSDHSRETLRAAGAGQKAELDLRESEARGLRADSVVARQRDLESTAKRGAMDGRHHRLRTALDEAEHLVESRLLRRLTELRDVGTGDEGPPRTDDDDRADVGVGAGSREAVAQPQTDPVAERVDRRITDRQNGDVAAPVEIDEGGDGCHIAGPLCNEAWHRHATTAWHRCWARGPTTSDSRRIHVG